METNRNLSLIFIFLICVNSIYAQARRYKDNNKSPLITILLRQNIETQAVDVLVSSTETVNNAFLEVNGRQIPIQVNKAYSMTSIPNNGFIKVVQINGTDIFQLAAVSIAHIIWSDAGTFAKANGGSLGDFGNNTAGGADDYIFGESGGEDAGGSAGYGNSSGSGGYAGNEFDPDRKGTDTRTSGRAYDARKKAEEEARNSSGTAACPAVQDSLNSLIRAVNGLVKLNQNLAAENKLLANKVDRIEATVMDTTVNKDSEKDKLITAKGDLGFSIMPHASYSKFSGDYVNPDAGGRFFGDISIGNLGANFGLSFDLSKTTRGHVFAGGGMTIIQQQGVGDPWANLRPMATLGGAIDLSNHLFFGANLSYTFGGGINMEGKSLVGYRRNHTVFGVSVGMQVSNGGGLYYRMLDNISLGTFMVWEFDLK